MPIKSILVVDDSPTDLKYLTDLLAKNGYQVVTAQNADQRTSALIAHGK